MSEEDPFSFAVDQVVMVETGMFEEPGTILNIHRNNCPNDDDDEDDTSTLVQVRLHVSKYKMECKPKQLRPMIEDSTTTTTTTTTTTGSEQDTTTTTTEQGQGPRRRSSRQPRRQQRPRSVVTPSPKPAAAATATKNQDNKDDDDDDETNHTNKKPAAKRKQRDVEISSSSSPSGRRSSSTTSSSTKSSNDKNAFSEEEDEDEQQVNSNKKISPFFKRTNKKARNDNEGDSSSALSAAVVTTAKTASTTSSSSSVPPAAAAGAKKKRATKKKKPREYLVLHSDTSADEEEDEDEQKKIKGITAADDDSHSIDVDELDDDDDDDDKIYGVSYAPTSRAKCRRCDEFIDKGTVRITHTPLFNGKPGYQVARHLHCAVFSDEVDTVKDVGGWRDIYKNNRDDYHALVLRIEESKLERDLENEELEPDELVQVNFRGEIRKPALGLNASLLPFQVEGISWMYHQEVHVPDIRGGLLADEMGMGKTIQTIATILDNRPLLQHSRPGAKHPPLSPDLEARKQEESLWSKSVGEWKHEMAMASVPKKLQPKKHGAARAGTLVVCPLAALTQWKSEIEKFTTPGTLSIGTYHGPNRASEMPADMMRKYDIVLTTYQVVEQDFRKMVSPNKVTCPNCGAKFKVDKLKVHLKYFCGEGAERTEAQARQHRSSERGGAPSRGGGGGSGSKNKKGGSTKKKAPMTKTAQRGKKAAVPKKTVRVKKIAGYDSDSELSIDSESAATPSLGQGRPSRSAAKRATAQLSKSVNQWSAKHSMSGSKIVKDDSSFNSDFDDDSDSELSSSDDEPISTQLKKRKAPSAPKPAQKKQRGDDPVARARKKQAQALAAVQKKKPSKGSKKAAGNKGSKGKGSKGKGRKKKFDSDSSSESSSEDSDRDPMEGIDMKALVNEAMAGSKFSVLHAFCWWRVVLDEAHYIKSRSSQTAAAAFSLTSIHRWCLSGTPLQNRVGELYSLIRFLRIDPMAHYFCRMKDCGCKSIHYRMKEGKCQDCGHRTFSHFAHFNKHVLGPIQRDGYAGDGRRAMFKLKNEVLDRCLLRRTKETKAEDMNLPPRIVTIRSVRLHPREEDFYEALYTQTKSSFDDYVAEGTLLNNYAHIFDLLTKMRQAVNHPFLIVYSKRNAVKQLGQKAQAVANGAVDCEMCHEPPTDRVLSTCCGSGFCRGCVIEYLGGVGGENTPCPSCRAPFTIDLNQESSADIVDDGTLTVPSSDSSSCAAGMPSLKELPHVMTGSILRRINLAEFATSTKIEVLVQELIEMRKKRPGSKALVFSQFVNMLDLVRWRLHSDPCLADLGLGVRILHGGMDVKSRDVALKDFREDSSCRVLLMSLKAAGVALNLTVASECFLLDLWWNPAAEMQAIDRCHRLGQYRPIRAVRFVAEGTVEERVLQLQEKKRLVFDGTVGRDAGSLKALSAEDMKALFV